MAKVYHTAQRTTNFNPKLTLLELDVVDEAG